MEHNLDNFNQNKWIRSCFGDSYYSKDSQLSFHGTSSEYYKKLSDKVIPKCIYVTLNYLVVSRSSIQMMNGNVAKS
jgi:hypothetical protein